MAVLPGPRIAPSRGWLNDPNGMIFRVPSVADGGDGVGRWHVFFQHNPAGPVHGDIHWGHVSSDDLVRWEEHAVAFGPTPGGPDSGGCWSGVAVEVGDGRVAAIYTGVAGGPTESSTCLRYAADPALDVWSPPVVVGGVPDLVALGAATCAVHEVRDPFVFPFGGRRWALLGGGLTDGTPVVLLWSCDDLEAWQFERVWLSGTDPVLAQVAASQIWECPQVVEVDGEAVVLLSTWTEGRLEGTSAVLGSLVAADDGSPVFRPRTGGRLDEGPAFYAPQVALDPDGPWLLGWVMEDGKPELGAEGVAGCLTLPRRLGLGAGPDGTVRVVSRVDPALAALLGEAVEVGSDGELPPACRLVVEPTAAAARVTLHAEVGEALAVEVTRPTQVWVDGEVVEVCPDGGVPSTHRRRGTARWALEAQGVALEVRVLVRPAPTGPPRAG